MSTNKSFSTETSDRYSCALFEIGKEANELEKIENDIKNFQSLHNASLELKNFIENPTHTIETQNQILSSLSEKLNFSKNLKNFFLLLIKKRRIFFVIKIVDSFFFPGVANCCRILASLAYFDDENTPTYKSKSTK